MNTKTKTDLRERIAVRAYFMWLDNGHQFSAERYWLRAEAIEIDLVKRRVAAAKKGAATRARQRFAIAALVPVVAAQKPAARRATAH